MTGRVCSFEGCGRPHHARGWCLGHYKQWQAGKPLAPIRLQPRVLTPEIAELDVKEFEFLLSEGNSFDQALKRMGVGARSMCRRYRLLGRQAPRGLWWLVTPQYRRAAS